MSVRLPALVRLAATALGGSALLAVAASGQVTGKPVTLDAGNRLDVRLLDLFGGCTLVAWRGQRIYASLLDSTGREAPGWAVNGVGVSQLGYSAYPTLPVKLSDDLACFVWTNQSTGSLDAYVGWLQRKGPSLPTPGEIITDTITARARPQEVELAVRQDDLHAIVALTDYSVGVERTLLKQIGFPGAPSTGWPSGGIVLEDSIRVLPVSACGDGSMGCFLLVRHEHNCVRPPPPTPSPPCAAELRLHRFIYDGSPHPSWTSTGVLVTDAPGWNQSGIVVSDRQSGAYVAWYDSTSDTVRVLAQHFGPDGERHPAWNQIGNAYPPRLVLPSPDMSLFLRSMATTSSGVLILLLDLFSSVPWLVAVQPDGSLVSGWPETGLRIPVVGDGSFWEPYQYKLGVTPEDRIIVGGAHTRYQSEEGTDLWAIALAADGTVLPGWQAPGQALCSTTGGQFAPDLALSANGTFKMAWLDTRIVPPETTSWPYVFYDHFHVSDGTVPTVASARLTGHIVEGQLLRASWWLADGGAPGVVSLRALDEGEFGPNGVLTRTGEHELTLSDSLPADFSRASYVLARMTDGRSHPISDTLVIQPRRDARGLAVRCPSPQYGRALSLDLDASASAEAIDVTVFDIAGRRVHGVRSKHPGAGVHRLTLEIASAQPGLYFVRVVDTDGHRATTQVVRLR